MRWGIAREFFRAKFLLRRRGDSLMKAGYFPDIPDSFSQRRGGD
jgi:hypothetical protein